MSNRLFTYHSAKLPLTDLHYVKCGSGEPLIMVPATISLIDDWLNLVQFMGQRFESYFFELPGHGKSSAFPSSYSSQLTAQTVADFADSLGFEKFNLMGFSFGGLLTMEILSTIPDRIDKVILISPCINQRAVQLGPAKRELLKQVSNLLSKDLSRDVLINLLQDKNISAAIIGALKIIGNLDDIDNFNEKVASIKPSTLEALSYQFNEMISFNKTDEMNPFSNKCFYAMSVYDPLLKYEITTEIVNKLFPNLASEKLYFPYHQPPQPFTVEFLNENFGKFLEQM